MAGGRLRLSLRAERRDLAAALARIDAFLKARGVAEAAAHRIRLAADELVNNVIDHGYPPGAAGPVRLLVVDEAGGPLALELSDDAPLFDPFSLPAPDVTSGLDERPLRGLGVHLVRGLSARVAYAVRDGRNHLRVELEREPAG